MSNEQDKAEESSNRQVGIGPGERLQAARIKKGLSLEDVAGRMHLSTSILEAIEENNFDEITAPIFVKGYLRAYARIVSLSEDEMIQQYIDFYSEEDPPISSTSNMVPELSVADARIKWTTYLVILVLGVLLAAWWWNKQQDEAPPISLDTQSSAVEQGAGVDENVVDSNIEAGSEVSGGGEADDDLPSIDSAVTVEVEPAEVAAEETGATAATAADSGAAESAGVTATEPPLAAEVEPSDINAEADPEAEAAAEAATAGSDMDTPAVEPEASVAEPASGTRERPSRVAPSGSDKLKMIVNADTWADVKDANSHQLVYDLLRAGSEVELTGQAPFAVFLGNGHGVELLLNGEEIGISSIIRDDNTARLNVGG